MWLTTSNIPMQTICVSRELRVIPYYAACLNPWYLFLVFSSSTAESSLRFKLSQKIEYRLYFPNIYVTVHT